MPVRVLITEGTRADCKEAIHLIDGISAETLLADRGYDTNQIIAYAADAGMNIVIPAKRNRKQQREYDRYLYRLRHLVENAFLHLKRWRGIATRYAKTTTSFLAAVQIRCIAIWCQPQKLQRRGKMSPIAQNKYIRFFRSRLLRNTKCLAKWQTKWQGLRR